ncbi:hypothetical protein CYMTET_41106 [Cymbomonas tetramitiformis]|uniref:Peptidase S1 domain-containing protein n=1 Tax=Cymbomonas tetramitiformis TaxID=36881 RepID=A0AAE0C6T9_9CHLO|nr:hypothetical protein CYMTET_41106 [Cymbomonas tetramitiformis]
MTLIPPADVVMMKMGCTGTFIDLTGDVATTLVLTAGHCIQNMSDVVGTKIVRTTYDGNVITGYTELGTVEDAVLKNEGGEEAVDIALLRVTIADGMQSSITEMQVSGFSDPLPEAGEIHTLVGFGDDACTHTTQPDPNFSCESATGREVDSCSPSACLEEEGMEKMEMKRRIDVAASNLS